MKKKFLGRVLTMLLVASMVFTLLPAPAIAAGNWWWNNDEYTEEAVPTATADENYHYNIFFLDCGRKYYSVDSIKQLIDNASAAGFNYIQLAVGNDGLRFLLGDMSLTVNGTTYSSQQVSTAIHAGNEAYYNFETDELTQSEMDTIIAYAKDMGMGVIPCVNTPGHMDAILSAATSLTKTNCSYSGSKRTIDVTNATAVAFTQALLQKYINYFADKGCQLFNMGADEYANDIYTGGAMGFGNLQDSGNYRYYVTYVNAVAAMIKKAGMKPMAFNDGIYYGSNTSSGEFDKDIIICYWSAGWSGYDPMSAAALANKGFKLVNTNGAYYWVLGKTDAQCDANKAANFSYLDFPRKEGQSNVNESAGSMFCIWADYPGAETEADVVSKTADTIKAFGGALPVLTPSQPDTGITITPSKPSTGGASNTVTMGEQMTLTANEKVYWRWNSEVVELTSADPVETVSMAALYAEQSLYAQSVNVKPLKAGDAGITVAADETGTPQPYSLTVVNSAAPAGVTVDLKVDEDKTVKVDGANYAGEYSTENPAVATVTVTGQDAYKTDPTYKSEGDIALKTIASGAGSSWTKTKYWYKPSTSNGEYYPVYAKKVGLVPTYYVGYSKTDNANDVTEESKQGFFDSAKKLNVYTRTEGEDKPASTTITFRGVAEGTTYVTIGGTRYTIKVSYYEQPVNVVLDQSKQVAVSGRLNDDGLNTDVATVSVDGTTMTVTGVAEGNTSVIVGNTKYNITVSKEDLEAVNPLKIEYWITNGPVQRSENDTTNYFTISAAMNGIATPNGVEVTANTMIPKEGYKKDGGRTVYYWHCRLLDTSVTNTYGDKTQKQTDKNGDDETDSGVAFTKIRYYNGNWEVFTEKSAWVKVEEKHQLVAYYKEYLKVTDEVESYAADWGNKGDGAPGGWLNSSEYCTLSIQVIYEDGTTNPTETTAAALTAKSFVYGYWSDNKGRGIGTVILNGTSDYEIVRVSAETGEASISLGANNATKITSLSWDNNEMTVWQGDNGSDEAVLHNPSNNFETDGTYANLAWDENKEAILLRVYVRAKVTEDSLTVNYVNQTTGEQFYSYNIAVASGKTFKPTIRLDNPAERNLLDGDVVNIKGVTQNVTADLIKMPGVPAQYRYSKYQCKELVKNDDKTITLYYTFNNSVGFVVDFGLPLTITPKDVNEKLALSGVTIESVKVENVTYGTCSIDGTNFTFTYTPGKDFVSSGSGEALTVKYTGRILNEETNEIQQSTVSYQVYIYPASNVLYEASFLTQVSEDNGPAWTAPTTTPRTQQTQKVGDTTTDYHVFGRDEAYDEAYGALGAWTATGLKAGNGMTKALTTNFYGNGFDLIGKCGPKTGSVVALIKNTETNKGKFIDVDTRYQNGDIYQVPLLHVTLAEGPYTVTIYGGGLEATNATPASYSLRGAATYASDYSVDSHNADLYSILAENGLTMADVEYVKVDSAPAAAKTARRATSFYALDTSAETGPVTHEAGDHVEIDGFRVYRSTNNTNYPESEKNVQYLNILDAVSSFTAFVEGSGSDIGWTARKDYENAGGPQNEIYLRKTNGENSAIAFKINPNAIVQISARAVENGKLAKLVVNGTETVIATNTEMYYTVKANERGIVTIKNTGEGMLALGNLKIKNGTQAAALSEEDYPAAIALLSLNAAPETPDTVFEPTISAKVTTTKFIRSKVVTLTVSASADVAKLTVNGKELRPTNGWLVSMGWSKSYNYILTETVKKSETKAYEIIGYSADGTPSTPTVVKSK